MLIITGNRIKHGYSTYSTLPNILHSCPHNNILSCETDRWSIAEMVNLRSIPVGFSQRLKLVISGFLLKVQHQKRQCKAATACSTMWGVGRWQLDLKTIKSLRSLLQGNLVHYKMPDGNFAFTRSSECFIPSKILHSVSQ